jgi:hypothetical protein
VLCRGGCVDGNLSEYGKIFDFLEISSITGFYYICNHSLRVDIILVNSYVH